MIDYFFTLTILVFSCSILFLRIIPSRYVSASKNSSIRKDHLDPKVSVQVLVLGDIGRSPRMQYHAISISKHGGRSDIIGYQESALHPNIVDNPLVTIIPLSKPPRFLLSKSGPFFITGPLKVLWQSWTIIQALAYRTKPSRWVLVQNPPSIPTLFITLIVCFLRNTHLIIDWHNLGWTILAGTKGLNHPFVRIHKYYEVLLGGWAPTANFTVSDAMRRALMNPPYNIKSPILTLHDRPADIFQPITRGEERLLFLENLPETSVYSSDIIAGNTKLIVSSTSWTSDEDFDILLEALCLYTTRSESLPSILAIITGKGPQKEFYLERIANLYSANRLRNITISTCWLKTEDYAKLLACADIGVSLHVSSSGLDLPMKVLDMFGVGLPVVGYCAYESWKELVIEGINGKGFKNSEELSNILGELFSDRTGKKLLSLRSGAAQEGRRRWDDEWDHVAERIFAFCD